MKISAADVIAIMKEVGIDEAIIKGLKNDVPLLSQGLDSIDLPALAAATETKYRIDLSEIDAVKVKTIDDYVRFVNEKIK
ncbi:MAG: phosphopantetheine-binding protein [Deltaproteobacteria bacterium]|nr:phosphopantetheine-binding protein [Deltaproteobacteria bacterium]